MEDADRHPVSREVRFVEPDDPYPTEFVRYDDGTCGVPDLPLGRWTGRVAAPGEPAARQRVTGGRITRDDLHGVTVVAAQQLGWVPSGAAHRLGQLLYGIEASGGRLGEAESAELAALARAAVRWLDEHVALPGRRFVLTDALYLVEGEPGTTAPGGRGGGRATASGDAAPIPLQ